jgi:hypothetical protein
MRKLVAALLSTLWLVCAAPAFAQGTIVGPGNIITCTQMVSVTLTGTGSSVTTSLLNGATGKIVAVCGWHVTESGTTAGTFQLEYGTQGGPCSSPTTMTPGFSVSSTAPATDHIDFASMSTPASAQLCVVTTGASTSTLQIGVYVSQY